jgi:hypothetical protein
VLFCILCWHQSNEAIDAKSGRITFAGFVLMFRLFLEKRRTDACWIVLEKYGYGFDLKLRSDYLPLPSELSATIPSSSAVTSSGGKHSAAAVAAIAAAAAAAEDVGNCELSPAALEWLTACFHRFDRDRDGGLSTKPTGSAASGGDLKLSTAMSTSGAPKAALQPSSELAEVFAPSPVMPFTGESFLYFSTTANGALDLSGWLSNWSSLMLFNPIGTLYQLCYIGAPKSVLESAIVVHAYVQLLIRCVYYHAINRESCRFHVVLLTC